MINYRNAAVVAIALLVLAVSSCSKDVFYDLQPGDCVQEQGLGLSWEGGVKRIDCSQHDPFNIGGKTWVVGASGDTDATEQACPAFGIIITEGDYAVCFSNIP